ncbi:tRNA(fMet)-specific endonuclease VapC [Methanobrevibacter cuticularis]|uniref:tRNA(FMet)-specific endonuclease VapC n=1 Tax=Methanobrevibacter cuticularis TaxID=47311 RepID=A0A166CMH6_9EURY|nr:PIN domain-containing protein [Methanobrevibacter cuticularis]KZX14665.1 tRNA(fMet)-specific endonuclease VapC [Methanobrevibacter cuticularis]
MILVDTNFLVGLYVTNDQWHEAAVKISDEVYNQEKIITDLIISEIITLIASKVGAKESKNLYYHILDNYQIYEVDRELYTKSINTLLKYDGTLSLADSLSVEIMKEIGIQEIVSFDKDFDKVDGIIRRG